MKKQEKRSYLSPVCQIVSVSETSYLMDTSFPSQHRPAHHGGTISSAKASMSWEEDKDEENQDHHGKTNRELLTNRTK